MAQQKTLRRNSTALNTANRRGCFTQHGKVKRGSRSRRTHDHQSRIPTQTSSSQARPAPDQQQPEQGQERRRYTQKKPARPDEMAASSEQRPSNEQRPYSATGIPRPKELPATEDYWLLDLWRAPLEKSPHQAQNTRLHTNRTLHTTTNTRQTRCYQADPWEDNNHQANIRSKMVQDRWRLDNQATSNFECPMDWLNKLWGEHLIQRRDTRCGWRRPTRSKSSKRTHSTSATNTTGESRAWTHTSTFQKLVSKMRSQQG